MSHAVGQNSLTPWGNNSMNFCLAHDQVTSCHKANDFFTVFSRFKLGVINNKTFNDWPPRKQSVLFPLDLNISLCFTSGNIEGFWETKLTVSLGALIATVHQGCLDCTYTCTCILVCSHMSSL